MLDLTDQPPRRDDVIGPDLASALVRAAGAFARLDQALGRHPLQPAFLHRFRLEAVRQQAGADGRAIDPWHLAAVIEGLPLRMPNTRIIDNGMVAAAARDALALHQWLTAPDFGQEGEVQRAARALAAGPSGMTPLLLAAQVVHAWLDGGEARPPIRAALVRYWRQSGLLRMPVPLTGARSLSAGTPWRPDLWIPHFLDAVAREAEDGLDLLFDMERAWLSARAAVPARRSTSRAPAALDLMAATPLISATTLARGIGMSIKSAIALLEVFVRADIAVEVTHRAARRLFGLKGVGDEVKQVVRPPYRPEPGRGPGRPRLEVAEEEVAAPAPLPAFNPITRLFPPIDYSRLDAAMAHTDQVLRETRRRLGGLARETGAAPIPVPKTALAVQSDDLSNDPLSGGAMQDDE